jgi:hypothetical protein
MRSYEMPMPRMSLGLAAIALSAVMFGLTVMLPTSLYAELNDRASHAQGTAATPNEVSIIPARIVVTAPCEKSMAYEPAERAVQVVDRSS